MSIDDNKEAVAMMKNTLGSLENRFREAYNKGYKDGLKDGASQVTAKLVAKILEETEQTEPSCDTCKLKDTTEWCKRQEVCRAYQPETEPNCSEKPNNCEPQTDCPKSCPSRDICTKDATDCAWGKGE